MEKEIRQFTDGTELARAAAEYWLRKSREAIAEKGSFSVALSGGTTPKRLFQILSQPPYANEIDWRNCLIFFGDERYVPHDHADSNYHTAREHLFRHVKCPAENIFPMPTDGENAESDAERYESQITKALGPAPTLDLVFLGLGPDGHTASLFPQTTALVESQKAVVGVFVDKLDTWRITLTYPMINRARNVMFLVEGEGKAPIIKEILEKQNDIYPAEKIRAQEQLLWYLDESAAAQINI